MTGNRKTNLGRLSKLAETEPLIESLAIDQELAGYVVSEMMDEIGVPA